MLLKGDENGEGIYIDPIKKSFLQIWRQYKSLDLKHNLSSVLKLKLMYKDVTLLRIFVTTKLTRFLEACNSRLLSCHLCVLHALKRESLLSYLISIVISLLKLSLDVKIHDYYFTIFVVS